MRLQTIYEFAFFILHCLCKGHLAVWPSACYLTSEAISLPPSLLDIYFCKIISQDFSKSLILQFATHFNSKDRIQWFLK